MTDAIVKARRAEKPLSRRQEKVIAALLECRTVTGAAEKSDTAKSTIYRWIGESPAFRDAYDEARRRLFSETLDIVRGASAKAIARLVELLDSRDPSQRRQAATTILEFAFDAAETEDFSDRISKLEVRLVKGFGT